MNLPDGILIEDHQGDLILIGAGLTADRYADVLSTMPPDIRSKFIGFKTLHR